MYRVAIDTDLHRVEVAFIGDFASHDANLFFQELKTAVAHAQGPGGFFDVVWDLTDSPVLPQARAGGGIENLAWMRDSIRKSATVVKSTLLKMQVGRLIQDPRNRYFGSRAEAIAWLDEPESSTLDLKRQA
jgi:hypothetical protein